MRILSVFLICFAFVASADEQQSALLEFMGGHGCTISQESRNAARASGFTHEQINTLMQESLSNGAASPQAIWIVLGEEICDIRLPDITTSVLVTDPDIMGVTSAIDEYAKMGQNGCFLKDAKTVFNARHEGDANTAETEYTKFLASHFMSGDLRFYGEEVLETPIGIQVMTGDCADVPQRDVIEANHAYLVADFGSYVRALGKANSCIDPGASGLQVTRQILPDNKNSWLFFEYDIIAIAAGWYTGGSDGQPRSPRPPLCHY
ncbi:hypothetical protein [Parasulfitobacter algicola]|uniref:Uncharacterized protein n=1 Tax=Parasulfitobacter algicola TaxID=2614809 RepID=A0ABX2IXY3_9RHOB|nr:hypothetical protein [Sulfitobacter algicola]NSX55371.1 hypothetical protein [Sulfitobacter algicola]